MNLEGVNILKIKPIRFDVRWTARVGASVLINARWYQSLLSRKIVAADAAGVVRS
ncbi:hypothetical protein [Sinorhizobium meliloti]|uniref:hypothetical protein n=1 Tax=Rhizobium meliloti TaxID=382 RepID=UPI0013E29D19|nr:hypothetical protein [Sinorhizobium meliloti]WQO84007.1 hypothetical protein U8C44_36195 [Sinorhizobium meliloti]